VRRDLLPQNVETKTLTGSDWGPEASLGWPSGYSWAGERDWTNRAFDAGSGDSSGQERRLVAGMGAPLESGNNYYVGIYNDSANAAGYTIESLGIGSGQTFPVNSLDYAAGSSATISNLAPREAKYDKVTIEPGTPSWEFTLTPTTGEMMHVRAPWYHSRFPDRLSGY